MKRFSLFIISAAVLAFYLWNPSREERKNKGFSTNKTNKSILSAQKNTNKIKKHPKKSFKRPGSSDDVLKQNLSVIKEDYENSRKKFSTSLELLKKITHEINLHGRTQAAPQSLLDQYEDLKKEALIAHQNLLVQTQQYMVGLQNNMHSLSQQGSQQ